MSWEDSIDHRDGVDGDGEPIVMLCICDFAGQVRGKGFPATDLGADRGYWMTCVADACATETQERHDHALRAFGGYCRVLSTDATLALVAAAR